MYTSETTDAQAAAFGFKAKQLVSSSVEIWPDNVQTVNVFVTLGTQWRVGMSGARTGLDYSAIQPVMRLLAVPRGEWTDVFEGIRTMEDAALATMRKKP